MGLASDSGEIYRIFVSYPAAEAPAASWPAAEMPQAGWPVLYVLDGNAAFAGFAEARRVQERSNVGKSIIVGVGYPTDTAYDVRRLLDSPPARPIRLAMRGSRIRTGGWTSSSTS